MKKGKLTGATLTSLICLYLSSGEAAASTINSIEADQVITDTQNVHVEDNDYDEVTEITNRIKTKEEDTHQYHSVYIQDSKGVSGWIRTGVKPNNRLDDIVTVENKVSAVKNETLHNDVVDCIQEILASNNGSEIKGFISDNTLDYSQESSSIIVIDKEKNKVENTCEKNPEYNATKSTPKDDIYFSAADDAKKAVSLSDFDTLRNNAETEMAGYLKRHIGANALRLLVFKLKWQNQYSYDEKVDCLIGYGAAINKSDLPESTKHEFIDMMCYEFNRDGSEEKGCDNLTSIDKEDEVPRIYVSKIILHDAEDTLVKNSKIEKILSNYIRKRLSMDDFNKIISELNGCLRSEGYPAATCYLPEQENASNEVFINVEFGRLGNLILENESNLNDGFINSLLSDVKTGEIVRIRNLETAIYNINGIGGVQAAGFFRPGEKTGETDVVIRVKNTKQDNYIITADNFGGESSGRYHYNFMGELINKLGNGERIALNASTSDRKQRNYGFTYEQVIAKNGTKANINISNSDYELGRWYSSMGVTGRATNYGIGFTTPLWKTGTSRMGINFGFVHRRLMDEMRAVDYVVKKHSDSAYLGINGSELIGKTAINYDFTATAGRMTCDDAHIMGYPLRLASEGIFTKCVLGLYGRYSFDSRFDFTIGGRIQRASNLMDSSEQFFLGGARGVRAYPQGEGAGDEGYLATAELTYHTGIKGLSISTFYDTGHVDYAKDHSVLGGIYLSGWGLGLTYRNENCWARIDYARRIGLDEHASKAAEAKDRIWFTAGIRF